MDNNNFKDVPSYPDWIVCEEVKKGWSKDKKYYIEDTKGQRLLLRISGFHSYESKKREFELMKEVYRLGIPMSKPIEFGICGDGKHVYSLLSWIDGTAADEVIQSLSTEEQYNLGFEAGKVLKKIHSIPAPVNHPDWEEHMLKKLKRHLDGYKSCGVKLPDEKYALEYIENNLHLLKNRPQCYQHGDFHIGNLIISPDKTLGVIDFNRWDYGDPFEEFYKTVQFTREMSIPFAKGQIYGYFEDKIPDNFFNLVALYIADVILFSIAWAMPFGEDEVRGMLKRGEMILRDYDNFSSVIPKWFNR